ncbi:MAG: glycosyltransferase family 39 protein [Elusimicrobiota bacterium]
MGKRKRKPRANKQDTGNARAVFWPLPTAFAVWFAFIGAKLVSLTDRSLYLGLLLPFAVKTPRTVPLAELAGGYLLDLIYLAAFAFAALGYGMPLVRWMFRTPLAGLERALIAQAFGLGALALLTLFLGAAAGVTPGLAFALLGAGIALTAVELLRWLKRRPAISPEHPGFFSTLAPLEWLLLAVLAYSVFYHLLGALAPETFYDSLVYHLGAPNTYRLRGRIVPIEGILHTNFPQNMEMLYLLGMLFRGEILAKLMHLWMMLLTVAAIYGLGRTACSRQTALCACALFCTVPVTAFAAWHTSVECGAAFWSLMGIWALVRGFYAQESPQPAATARWFLVSGIFHGLALGVKYTAAWNAAAALVLMLLWLYRAPKIERRAKLLLPVLWSLAALAVFAPWLVKNALFTGNPVYPFLGAVFGQSGLYPDAAALKDSARGHFWYGGLRHWQTWLLTPWLLFTQGRSHYSFIGPLLVAFFPLIFRVRKAVFPFGWLLLAFGVQYIAWSASSSMVRFFIPALALFCLYAAHQLTALGREWRPWAPWLVVPIVLWNLAWNGAMLLQKEVPVVVFGHETKEQYLGRAHIGYPPQQYEMARYINATLPPDARLMLLGDVRTAFLERDSATCSLFDEHPFLRALRTAPTAAGLQAILRAGGFTHVLADYPETLRNLQRRLHALTPEQLRILSRFWRGHLRPVRRNAHDVALYELTEPAGMIPAAGRPAELPEIIRIALDGNPALQRLDAAGKNRLLKSLAD